MKSSACIICAVGALLGSGGVSAAAPERGGGASAAPPLALTGSPQGDRTGQDPPHPQTPPDRGQASVDAVDAVADDDPFTAAGFAPVAEPNPALTAAFQRQAATRRTMLTVHQSLGLATLASVAGVSISGAMNLHDLYGGGRRSGRYLLAHRLGVYSAAALFLSTGAMSLLAPSPYEKGGDETFDTADGHKLLVSLATVGMIAQTVLGFVTARRAEAGNPRALKKMAFAHQWVGLGTLGALSAAAIVWVF